MTTSKAQPLKSRYDAVADVLYLTIGKPERSARTREDDFGLLWRVNPSGDLGGVTVMAYEQLWTNREAELISILSSKLQLPVGEVRSELSSAH